MTSLRVAPIVFTCVALWLTSVSTAQTLAEADAGITRAGEGEIGPATVRVDAVRYFLRNPDQLTNERIKVLYLSSPTLHGKARLAYLAMRMDPRSGSCSLFGDCSRSRSHGAEERYLCDRASGANSHYWRPPGFGCGWFQATETYGLSAEAVKRINALLATDVDFEKTAANRVARAQLVYGWVCKLGREEKCGRGVRFTSMNFVGTLVERERRILPQLLPMIEQGAVDGRVVWPVAFNAFLASGDKERALAFTRKNMLHAMNSHRLSACGVQAVMERWGETSDIALIKSVVPQITDDFVRTVVGPDLEKVIEIRMEREANEAWARKYVEAWKRRAAEAR